MKFAATLSLAVLLLGSSAAVNAQPNASSPPKVCLNVRDIERTEPLDDRTIAFHMRGGKIWHNKLRTACPMLKISSYSQTLHSDLICSNQQFIHVALTGNNCALGDFTPVEAQR